MAAPVLPPSPAPPVPAPPAPAPSPAPAPIALNRSSLTNIPPEYLDHTALSPHFSPTGELDLPGLLKSYISAESLIGGERVPVPKADAPPEEWARLFDRLGRPASPDKYELKDPEGTQTDPVLTEGFKAAAHKIGLSGSQAQALHGWFLEIQKAEAARLANEGTATHAQAETALRTEFGKAYDEKVARGGAVVKRFGGPALAEFLDSSGLGNHPAMVKFAIAVGEALAEDTLSPAINGPSRFGLTPDAAKAEIHSLMADPAYYNGADPRHADVVAKIGELAGAAYAPPPGA